MYVGYSFCGRNGEMFPHVVLELMENDAYHQNEEQEIGTAYMEAENTTWVVVGWDIRFLKPVRLEDEIEVHNGAFKYVYSLGYRGFLINDMEGNELIYATSLWTYMKRDPFLPCKIGSKIIDDSIYLKDFGNREFNARKMPLPEGDYEEFSCRVRATDIDGNDHMNNARYLEVIYEHIWDLKFNHIMIEYKKGLFYNENYKVRVYENEKGKTFLFIDGEDELASIIEVMED